jgi:Leucine-rich repeat (LRR) protein
MTHLIVLDLSFNGLQGSIPIPSTPSELIFLDYSNNEFSSIEPNFVGRYLRNAISINLSKNKLSGHIPLSVCSLNNLQIMAIYHLEVLDVGNNQIVDSFPSWLGTLPKLRILVLRSNQLNGTIRGLHDGYQHFTSLQIVDLASNHFSGELHSEWFENLGAIDDE